MGHVRKLSGVAVPVLLLVSVAWAWSEENALDQLNAMSQKEFQALNQRAKSGDAPAQTLLGIAYMQGIRVQQDDAEAFRWFKQAAKRREEVAQNNLGKMYFYGRGTTKNYAEAFRWFSAAAAEGSASAQFSLAVMYHNGYSIPKNMEQASKWYEVAAISGDASAQNTLGYLYEHGEGVAKNADEAAKWYAKSAAQGNKMAAFNLARMQFSAGDHAAALQWYLKAAELGHPDAPRALAQIYLHGHCMEVQYREALRWLNEISPKDEWALHAAQECREHLSVQELNAIAHPLPGGGQ